MEIDWFEKEKNILKQIPNWIIKYRTIKMNNFFFVILF